MLGKGSNGIIFENCFNISPYYYGCLYGDGYSLLWRWSDKITFVNLQNLELESDWEAWKWYSETHPRECFALQQSSDNWLNRNCSDELPFICRKSSDLNDNLEDFEDNLEIYLLWK